MDPRSATAAIFDALYRDNPDPWGFLSKPYEQAKYDATLACLSQRHFASAFEIGCSIGVLSLLLAPRCDRLLAVDLSETALAQARARLRDRPGVDLRRMAIPDDWPDESFDLIVLSEVLYFLAPGDIDCTAALVRRALRPGGVGLLVNYTGPTDTPCTGDEATARFAAACGLTQDLEQRAAGYRIDRFVA
jgi:SAM-dependent methyltransferase